jgi:chemotaxis family two-component system response regulator Rcp1
MHVLLVEDDPHDIFLFDYALKMLGQPIQLSVRQDGEQALVFLFKKQSGHHEEQPDIIVLDINVPRQNGFDVLAALERDAQLKFIPVVVLTTSSSPDDINRCYELGANAYLEKPFGFEPLLALVRTIVEFWSKCKFRTQAHPRPLPLRSPGWWYTARRLLDRHKPGPGSSLRAW